MVVVRGGAVSYERGTPVPILPPTPYLLPVSAGACVLDALSHVGGCALLGRSQRERERERKREREREKEREREREREKQRETSRHRER